MSREYRSQGYSDLISRTTLPREWKVPCSGGGLGKERGQGRGSYKQAGGWGRFHGLSQRVKQAKPQRRGRGRLQSLRDSKRSNELLG